MKTILEQNIWGVPLGRYELFIRYAGQTFYSHLEGQVYDASTLFTGKESVAQFKELIFEEIDALASGYGKNFPENVTPTAENKAKKQNGENSDSTAIVPAVQMTEQTALQKARETFSEFDFSEACRVLILEENLNKTKHIILQVGRLNTLAEYATYNHGRGWSMVLGSKSMGKVDGLGLTFPHEWKMPEIGNVIIHIFCPDDPRHSTDSKLKDTLANAKPLADIVPWIPQAVNVDSHLRAYRAIINQQEQEKELMGETITEMRIALSAAQIATNTAGPEGEPLPIPRQKETSALTLVCYGLPIVLFGVIGFAFVPWGWIFGAVGGLFVGAFADSKRR